ncbi:MAG: hypothetical protein JST26_14880 [Bacteroidetes bacterium]|nr:hypothetical protein [Bacteroidota bacterium]
MQEISLIELNKPELFEKFRQQLYKDFEMSGCEYYNPVFSGNSLDAIHEAVTKSVSRLNQENNLQYYALLYRIDLSEAQIHKRAGELPETPLMSVVAELIIKRILQKVILKQLYSK